MTSPRPVLDMAGASAIAARSFVAAHHGQIGAEVEWLVFDRSSPTRTVPVDEVRGSVGPAPLPAGGAVSFEPGGQIELSTAPAFDPVRLLDAIDRDADELERRLAPADLVLVDLGLDPIRPPVRSLHQPRYAAMAAAFERQGGPGHIMMCSTASLQINVDFGDDAAASWRHLSSLAPVLRAAFANSPIFLGIRQPQRCTRGRVWTDTDPTRTAPVPTSTTDDWGRYALDAEVLMIRHGDDIVALSEPMTLRHWIEHGHRLGFPDDDDVAYHLTTLFPPVRPRGWLELRCIDAVPPRARRVAVAVVWALATHPEAGRQAAAVCGTLADPWDGALDGLGDNRALAGALHRCLTVAADTLRGAGHVALASEVCAWRDGPVAAGRTPADDVLDRFDPRVAPSVLAR